MSAQHTPGPYRAEGPDFFGDWNILHEGDSLAIGAVVSNLRPADEVKANACLLSSAPELLEALEDAVEIIDDQLGFDFPDSLAAFRTAIAKAKGESA